jgi:hypothetical protein
MVWLVECVGLGGSGNARAADRAVFRYSTDRARLSPFALEQAKHMLVEIAAKPRGRK